jgi:hypothetical protein
MFQNVISRVVRSIITETVSGWSCTDVAVGLSGDFTIERVLHELNRFNLHGNDVTLHASALGHFFAGSPLVLAVSESFRAKLGWLDTYLVEPNHTVATVLLARRLAETMNKEGGVRDDPHHIRMFNANLDQWPVVHTAMVNVIDGCDLSLDSFVAADAVHWLDELPLEKGVATYLPFAAGGMYQGVLDTMFDWQRPVYAPIDRTRRDDYLGRIVTREHWLFAVKAELPKYADHLIGYVHDAPRSKPVYVYASKARPRVGVRGLPTEKVLAPKLKPGMDIGERITVAQLALGQFNTLRAMYQRSSIPPAEPTVAYAVLVDGHIIGAWGLSVAPVPGRAGDKRGVYLMSAFAVHPSDYERLPELVLSASLSREVQLLAESVARRRVRALFTTAFADTPPPKYKGLYTVFSEREAKEGAPYTRIINLIGQTGRWSLANCLKRWKDEYAHTQD